MLLFLVVIANIRCIVVKKKDGVVQLVKDLRQSGSDYNYRSEGTHRPKVLVPQLENVTPTYSVEKIKIVDPKTGRTTLVEKRSGELNDDYSSGGIEQFGRAALPYPIIGMRSNSGPGVQVSSSYRNVEQSSGPKYKQTIVTEVNGDQSSGESDDSDPKPLTNQFVPFTEPNQQGVMRDFRSKTTMKFPDGYAKEQKRRHEESSNYKNGVKMNKSYKTPESVGNLEQKDSSVDDNSIIKSITYPSNEPLRLDKFDDSLDSDYIQDVDDDYSNNDGYAFNNGNVFNGKWSNGGKWSNNNGFDQLNGYKPDIFQGNAYEKGNGKAVEEAYTSDKGEKGDKGYKKEAEYKKGQKETHGHVESKGEDSVKDSEKKAHIDEAKQYAEGHDSGQKQKASDYVQRSGHKKGHKKSGYHKVHHKDEYKKDEEFYDEEHNSGEQKSQGHTSEQSSHESGGSQQQGHVDAANHEAKSSESGGKEQGKSYKQAEGFKGENGEHAYHNQQEEHANKSEQKEKESGGYKDNGFGGLYGY